MNQTPLTAHTPGLLGEIKQRTRAFVQEALAQFGLADLGLRE